MSVNNNNYYITDAPEKRGLIWRKQEQGDDILVCKTFPYTEEYTELTPDVSQRLATGNWKLYPSYEGTIIRIVNDPETNTQLIATHKKVNAYESYWGSSKSFGELFETSIKETYNSKSDDNTESPFYLFLSLLPKNMNHTFLLCSNLENMIASNRDGEVFYVGSFDNKTNAYLGILQDVASSLSNFCNTITELEIPNNTESILKYMDDINPLKQQGIIAISDSFDMFKLVNPVYKSLSELRGNTPSLTDRYLELMRVDSNMLDDYVHFFSNYYHVFNQIQEMFDCVVYYLHNVVSERYKKGRYVNTSPYLHNIAKRFENDAKTEGVDCEKIKAYIKSLSVNEINGVINSYVNFLSKQQSVN